MNQLEALITELATEFAKKLVAGIGNLPMNEITAAQGASAPRAAVAKEPKAAKTAKAPSDGTRMPRRDPGALKLVIDSIVRALSVATDTGLRSEELQEQLSIDKKTITRPIVLALEGGLIRKEGEKRATTYFLGGGAQTGAKRAAKAKATKKTKTEKKVKAAPARKASAPKKKAAPPKKATAKRKSRVHVEGALPAEPKPASSEVAAE